MEYEIWVNYRQNTAIFFIVGLTPMTFTLSKDWKRKCAFESSSLEKAKVYFEQWVEEQGLHGLGWN